LSPVFLAVIFCGCATPALWRGTAARSWYPNPPDQVVTFNATNDRPEVAIFFTQYSAPAKWSKVRPAVWCPNAPTNDLTTGVRDIHRLTNSWTEVRSLPLYYTNATDSPSAAAGPAGHAVWCSTNRQLTLHLPGTATEPFALPACEEKTRVAARVIGLPFAVTADAAITCVVIFVLSASAYTGP
jgi:hypothetical protein